jgi:hypothetical protein
MGGLEVLRVDSNKILQLPVEMGSIFSLREFTFEGNELRTPPLEVLEHSTHAVLEYLKRMQMARKTQQLDLRALEVRLRVKFSVKSAEMPSNLHSTSSGARP